MAVSEIKLRISVKRLWLVKTMATLHHVMFGDVDQAVEFGFRFVKTEVAVCPSRPQHTTQA